MLCQFPRTKTIATRISLQPTFRACNRDDDIVDDERSGVKRGSDSKSVDLRDLIASGRKSFARISARWNVSRFLFVDLLSYRIPIRDSRASGLQLSLLILLDYRSRGYDIKTKNQNYEFKVVRIYN